VLVPVAWQEPAGDRTRDNPDDTTEEGPGAAAFTAALETIRAAHAGEVAALTGRVNVAESFAAELRGRLDDTGGKLADVQAELAAAMDRADQSAAELQAAQIALGEAQADVAELRQADAARKGRGLVARLRSALRGE
jgi:chromosome segregation ATPase